MAAREPDRPGIASTVTSPFVSLDDFLAAKERVTPHIHRTPLFSCEALSDRARSTVRLKAEIFQRTGSYKIRGPLNKLALLTAEERARGVICSSAGNHAQGVALAAAIYGMPATVVMAKNATPTKVAATRAYGAEVVLHGAIWDDANERALELAAERGLTYVHPFDDLQLIAGQGTLGLELVEQWPDVEVVVVPIGGGGLISGVAMAVKQMNPSIRVLGVESAGAPAMSLSVAAGHRVLLDSVDSLVDGLRVRQIGGLTLKIVSAFVDDIILVEESRIYEAVLWTMSRTKLVVEGAAAATVAAVIDPSTEMTARANVVCVLSGGNLGFEDLRGRPWN